MCSATRASQAREVVWRLVVTTVASCLRHRVTGLAAEAAFFAVLSVPPLIFAMAGAVGFVTDQFTAAQVADVRGAVIDLSERALTANAVDRIITPTIDDVLRGGRFDVLSLGFVLALWSGSRALNVFVDTITIMHGLGGTRGIVQTRALSFVLYLFAMVTGVVTLPLVVAGPSLVADWLPRRLDFLIGFYWPVVVVVCICFLATLYHVSVPVRTNWSFNLPGATFSLSCWVVGSYLLRWFLTATAADSRSIYGPLAAPIAVLLWLYLVSIAVLVGAAVNAAFDRSSPRRRPPGPAWSSCCGCADSGRATPRARGTDRFRPCRSNPATSRRDESGGRSPFPTRAVRRWWELGRRLLAAVAILVGTVLLVYLDRGAYRDGNDPPGYGVNLVDSIYYTTVTLSTTGYGDIAPVAAHARMINAFVITPLRIAFLVLLIGTTLEVLASQGRELFRVSRWRKRMSSHVVVIGYGTKGRAAVDTLVNNGQDRESIVVVDPGSGALQEAHADGLAVVTGDATRQDVLRRAGVERANQVIITTNRDDSNVLATLTVRQLNPEVWIVAAVREQENVALMRQSGANSVITSSDAVGRLLGLSSLSPTLGTRDGGPADLRRGTRGGRARPAGLRGRQAAAEPARPGDRGGARREGVPLLRPGRHPARPRRPADRRTPGQGAALGAAARHPRRGLRQRRLTRDVAGVSGVPHPAVRRG